MVWQVPTVEEFSPLKNHESVGRDCLSTCLRDFHGPNGKWIRDACVACCQQQQNAKQSDEGKQYNKQKENGQPRMNKLWSMEEETSEFHFISSPMPDIPYLRSLHYSLFTDYEAIPRIFLA